MNQPLCFFGTKNGLGHEKGHIVELTCTFLHDDDISAESPLLRPGYQLQNVPSPKVDTAMLEYSDCEGGHSFRASPPSRRTHTRASNIYHVLSLSAALRAELHVYLFCANPDTLAVHSKTGGALHTLHGCTKMPASDRHILLVSILGQKIPYSGVRHGVRGDF